MAAQAAPRFYDIQGLIPWDLDTANLEYDVWVPRQQAGDILVRDPQVAGGVWVSKRHPAELKQRSGPPQPGDIQKRPYREQNAWFYRVWDGQQWKDHRIFYSPESGHPSSRKPRGMDDDPYSQAGGVKKEPKKPKKQPAVGPVVPYVKHEDPFGEDSFSLEDPSAGVVMPFAAPLPIIDQQASRITVLERQLEMTQAALRQAEEKARLLTECQLALRDTKDSLRSVTDDRDQKTNALAELGRVHEKSKAFFQTTVGELTARISALEGIRVSAEAQGRAYKDLEATLEGLRETAKTTFESEQKAHVDELRRFGEQVAALNAEKLVLKTQAEDGKRCRDELDRVKAREVAATELAAQLQQQKDEAENRNKDFIRRLQKCEDDKKRLSEQNSILEAKLAAVTQPKDPGLQFVDEDMKDFLGYLNDPENNTHGLPVANPEEAKQRSIVLLRRKDLYKHLADLISTRLWYQRLTYMLKRLGEFGTGRAIFEGTVEQSFSRDLHATSQTILAGDAEEQQRLYNGIINLVKTARDAKRLALMSIDPLSRPCPALAWATEPSGGDGINRMLWMILCSDRYFGMVCAELMGPHYLLVAPLHEQIWDLMNRLRPDEELFRKLGQVMHVFETMWLALRTGEMEPVKALQGANADILKRVLALYAGEQALRTEDLDIDWPEPRVWNDVTAKVERVLQKGNHEQCRALYNHVISSDRLKRYWRFNLADPRIALYPMAKEIEWEMVFDSPAAAVRR